MVNDRLTPYRSYREYSDSEIRDEQGEYFDNDFTKKSIPELFSDEDDVTANIKDSNLELLNLKELERLRNSDISEILGYSTKGLRLAASIKLMKHYGKDWRRLLDAFINRYKLPPPLVIRDKNNKMYLMSGNSRMMMAVAFGYNMPVKVIDYKKIFVTEGLKMKKNTMIEIAKALIRMHGLKSKLKIDKSNNKADYEWISDTITVNPDADSLLDFVESILHECHHAKMRKKLGADGYEEAYTIAGQKIVDKGKDFYWDNPFEKHAEKYAEQNAKKYMKKIQSFAQ